MLWFTTASIPRINPSPPPSQKVLRPTPLSAAKLKNSMDRVGMIPPPALDPEYPTINSITETVMTGLSMRIYGLRTDTLLFLINQMRNAILNLLDTVLVRVIVAGVGKHTVTTV
jgi:hypothetical protein